MFGRIVILAALVGASIEPAHALSDLDRMQLASDLGGVLASESTCGLAYDQQAIEAFINNKVGADDMEFPSTLMLMTSGIKYQIGEMSQSALTAHCAQIRRIAKSYAFIK